MYFNDKLFTVFHNPFSFQLLATLPALLAHKKRHQSASKFHCDFCSEDFTNIQQLKSHRQKHFTEDKPYKCPICAKGFRTPTTLRTHKMLHTGEKKKTFLKTAELSSYKQLARPILSLAMSVSVSHGKMTRRKKKCVPFQDLFIDKVGFFF